MLGNFTTNNNNNFAVSTASAVPQQQQQKDMVEKIMSDISLLPQRMIFEGKDKRACALHENLFAMLTLEICHVAPKIKEVEEKGDQQQQKKKETKKRFCRITELELHQGGIASKSNQLSQISSFPLDNDEFEETSISNKNETDTENKKDENIKSSTATSSITAQIAEEKKKEREQQEKSSLSSSSSPTAATEGNILTLKNIELLGCPSGILIWRPGKLRHFFLRLDDGFVISLWSSSPVVSARIISHASADRYRPQSSNQTRHVDEDGQTDEDLVVGIYLLTDNNVIEGFNLNQVTPMLQAKKTFRAKLDLPIHLLFGSSVSALARGLDTSSPKKFNEQHDTTRNPNNKKNLLSLSPNELQRLEQIETYNNNNNTSMMLKNNNSNKNLDASATISQQFSPYQQQLTNNRGSKMMLNPNNFSFTSETTSNSINNFNNNTNNTIASPSSVASTKLAASLISSPQQQKQRELTRRLKKQLHAASFCQVPAHRLLNIKQNTFLLQVAEAKEIFAFTLPAVTAEADEEFEYHNQYEIYSPSSSSSMNGDENEDDGFDVHNNNKNNNEKSGAAQNEEEDALLFKNHVMNNNEEDTVSPLCLSGKVLRVKCHHVSLQSNLEDVANNSTNNTNDNDDEGEDEEKGQSSNRKKKSNNNTNNNSFLNMNKTNSLPIALIPSTIYSPSSGRLVVPSNHASCMHATVVDVQAGTFCLMLARRGANAVEFFLFSEHCILRALSPKTSSGHHKQLLQDETNNNNSNEDNHNNNNGELSSTLRQRNRKANDSSDSNENNNEHDVHASMFLYHSLPLVSSCAKKTQIRFSHSLENPNFLVLSFSGTNEAKRSLNFGVALPIFDRRRKVWAVCAAAQSKLWRGDSIPILGGEPYPPAPLCCPLPSNHEQQPHFQNKGRIQQNLPGKDQLAIFEYSPQTFGSATSSSSSSSSINLVDFTDLWIATIYANLDEQGASFTLTQQDENENATIASTTDIEIHHEGSTNTNLSTLLSLAAKQSTSVFSQVRHGVDLPICASHQTVQQNLSIFEQNQLLQLENALNQRHGETGKRMSEVLLTKIDNLAKSTEKFENKIHSASIEAHEQFFRNQGVEVIRNTFEQLEETRRMLESLKIGIEEAEEERRLMEQEEDEENARSLQDLVDRATNKTP